MCRVRNPDGLILWYDFYMDKPRNSDVKGVKLRELEDLFPKCLIRLERITRLRGHPAPAGAAFLAPVLRSKQDSLVRSHHIGMIRKANKTRSADR